MRIAIVGDLQYEKTESLEDVAREIAALQPDYTVLVGDYGYWEIFGSYAAFQRVAAAFEKAGIAHPIAIVGNHDVQNESGERQMPCGTVAANYAQAFDCPPKNTVLEFDTFRVICVHIEPQKPGDFYYEYECYVSPDSQKWLTAELEREPEKPTVLITHAPLIGCGLLTVPTVHVRAANAYLNQDHGKEFWPMLARQHRQIALWFSGHYHMGHHHPNSQAVTDGVAYFTVGAATSCSRDGQRHTRILDEEDGRLIVRTYNHDTGRIEEPADYIRDLRAIRPPYEPMPLQGVFSAGCGTVVDNGMQLGANGCVYAMTDNGFLWEVDWRNRVALGTLHYSDRYKLDGLATDEQYVWRLCGDRAFGHRYTAVNRFMREKDWAYCEYAERPRREAPSPGSSLRYRGRVACRVGDGLICSTYNDEEKNLWFEIEKEEQQ